MVSVMCYPRTSRASTPPAVASTNTDIQKLPRASTTLACHNTLMTYYIFLYHLYKYEGKITFGIEIVKEGVTGHSSVLADAAPAMLTGMVLSSVRMQRNSPDTHIVVTHTRLMHHQVADSGSAPL